MGIYKNLLVIEGLPSCSIPDLLESFGFTQVASKEKATLGQYIYPEKDVLAVSFCNNFTILAHYMLPLSMIESDFARRRYDDDAAIGKHFEKQNSLAVLLESSENCYAMRLKKDGRDFGIYGRAHSSAYKYGEMTPIELKYLENSTTDSAPDLWGKRIFLVDGEELTHDQIGEDIVLWNLQEFMQTGPGLLYDLSAEVFSVHDEHLYHHP
ncbi:hypothetical protein SAMN04488109_1658 [Chryseolinea serpens]|uniref:Uncharacterized protein n=1 Tax=Chryseolinea serpens TaxID=947013 RepID=A0A1M5MD05_9BACT|nr:hypothetical protein [Chryseolinea serpens]SHG74623.1 hypothetical protein SAMN04488109_1658 [Chryseolinea serpens]